MEVEYKEGVTHEWVLWDKVGMIKEGGASNGVEHICSVDHVEHLLHHNTAHRGGCKAALVDDRVPDGECADTQQCELSL